MFFVTPARTEDSINASEGEVVECCEFCRALVPGTYYRLDIHLACVACGEKVRRERNAAFVRAITFGVAAAIAGFAMYATIEMATGWLASAVSLVVGVMVGKAMMAGSGGCGERRYQVTAALLTYAAFAMATVPVSMVYAAKPTIDQRAQVSSNRGVATQTNSNVATITPMRGASTAVHLTRSASGLGRPQRLRLAVIVGMQLLAGLASPFLVLTHHSYQTFLMLVVLLIGMRIAWKTARGKQQPVLYGPF
jgi:hypothetical protein